MLTNHQYRAVSVLGVLAFTAVAVLFSNEPTVQATVTAYVPPFDRLEPTVLSGASLGWALAMTVLAVAASLLPLYKPRPRRVLDATFLAGQRVLVAGFLLATVGYFEWSHRLPRTTLATTVGLLLVVLPPWFVWIRQPASEPRRTLVVGDDLAQIERVAPAIDVPVLGYLCPSVVADGGEPSETAPDGGTARTVAVESSGSTDVASLDRLGGLSRLSAVLREYDVDTVILAFREADRAEFFGALETCHEHGVRAKVHRRYADCVLIAEGAVGELVDVDVEPWDPLDHVFKRAFDVCFALAGLLALAPLVALIALAIRLDGPGPILYQQDRTAGFGDTFPVYKFRTMVPEGESATPAEDEDNDRITRVGRTLRKTHLDELPQLWSILVGDMSVVGPRAAWTEEELLLEEAAPAWRKRWFVKPGLTGLAQVNDAKSTDPEAKLRYDLEYIRRQSFWLDVKLVIRQVWRVLGDGLEILSR